MHHASLPNAPSLYPPTHLFRPMSPHSPLQLPSYRSDEHASESTTGIQGVSVLRQHGGHELLQRLPLRTVLQRNMPARSLAGACDHVQRKQAGRGSRVKAEVLDSFDATTSHSRNTPVVGGRDRAGVEGVGDPTSDPRGRCGKVD